MYYIFLIILYEINEYKKGHFSKFITPNSVRVGSSILADFNYLPMNPDVISGLEVGVFGCERSVRQIW